MRSTLQNAVVAVAFLSLGLGACNAATSTAPPVNSPSGGYTTEQQSAIEGHSTYVMPSNVVRACPVSMNPDYAECFALIRTDVAHPEVSGYGPSQLQSAYNLPSSTQGAGQTIAVVDAWDQPNIASDLATYRSFFGLPACGSSNSCFQKVNQDGQPSPLPSPPPASESGWGVEISLDVEMISAGCPNCNIILVEADDNSFVNLGKATKRAVLMHAHAVSNSYGAFGNYRAWNVYKWYSYRKPVILASAGDSGYGPGIPAGFPTVVAVGGTELKTSSGSRGWTETVWSGTGSGCNTHQLKPTWQSDKGCAGRTMNDVAADASPATGVAVYDSYMHTGWFVVGGTSVASPLVASIYGLKGNGDRVDAAQTLYRHGASLYDVTSGSNGTCTPPASKAYLCTGEVGYDGPTGNGTPNGANSF